MKKLLLILFVLPFICFAQEVRVNKSNLSIGISFTPEYSYRTVKAVNPMGEWQKTLSENEKGKFGFTTGLNLDYRITDWLSFETGMLFTNKGYKDFYYQRENENDENLSEETLKLNFNYLEIPLNVKFYFAELAGFHYFASVGLNPNLFLSKNITSTIDGYGVDTFYPDGSVKFNTINFAGAVGLGFKYDINSNFFLETSAKYKHSFNKMNDQALKRFLYSFGLNLAVYYRL